MAGGRVIGGWVAWGWVTGGWVARGGVTGGWVVRPRDRSISRIVAFPRIAYSTPFVDGTPADLGSSAAAARSARATALNWASTMWWGLRP